MTTGRARWWLSGAAIGLGLLQAPVVVKTAMDPSQSDFGNYFTPAFALARGGELGELYDRDVFAAWTERAGVPVLGSFVPHPPANALWLLPLAWLPSGEAKALWTFALLVCIAVSIGLTRGLLNSRDAWLASVLVLAPFLAIRNNLAFGQPYLVLSALILGGVLALCRDRPLVGGFLLGLGVSFKPYALGVGFLFLHRERLRAFAGFVGGVSLPSLVLVALHGTDSFAAFATRVLPWMLRGDIQDPFSPVWGSVGALANRLFRLEPDLNPAPWIDAPGVARFLGAALPSLLVALGVMSGRRALQQGRSLDAVSVCVAFSLAASPFAASYHLVLLTLPAAALAVRLRGPHLFAWLLGWIALGSPLMNVFRESATPLAYSRFLFLTGMALLVARPYLRFSHLVPVVALGLVGGLGASFSAGRGESSPRIAEATGYSMFRPHYCGANLRWFVPSSDGRALETRGAGEPCEASIRAPGEAEVTSRFANGSFNLYLKHSGLAGSTRITFSDANEVDPVITPDGCAVVFASDQGRGLGSTALYRLDVSRIIPACGGGEPALLPLGSRPPG